MYKYSRDIMWSYERNCFIAEVFELPGCMADGETLAETMNHLDVRIGEWIETANRMGREIPKPIYYESVAVAKESDYILEPEDKKEPYYDANSNTWKVITDYGREEGDAIYIASEFVKGGLFYPFHSSPSCEEEYPDHAHDFSSVVSFLLKKPKYFSVEGFEKHYSNQELELINRIMDKMHIDH